MKFDPQKNISLKIGLTEEGSTYWETILRQEGLPYKIIGNNEKLKPYDYAVIIAQKIFNNDLKIEISKFVRSGGALITSSENKNKFENINFESNIKSTFHKNDFSYSLDEEDCINIDLMTAGSGLIAFVPFDLNKVFSNSECCKRYFYCEPSRVYDIASRLVKKNVRRLICQIIRSLYTKRKLPYIHLGYYPFPYQSLFSFRVDVDDCHKEHLGKMIKESFKYSKYLTWFISTEEFLNNKEFIEQLISDGHDVQSHGFYHHTFKSYFLNKYSLGKANKFLMQMGISPVAFVSPHAKWNKMLQKALEFYGYLFSSEFRLDHDNLPYFIKSENKMGKVLQVPIHPVCFGSFLASGFKPNDQIIKKYYEKVMERKVALREPTLFYGHPTDRLGKYTEIFHHFFALMEKHKNVWGTNMLSFARWWVLRDQISINAFYNPGRKTINVSCKNIDNIKMTWNPAYWVFLENKIAVISMGLSNVLDLNSISFQANTESLEPWGEAINYTPMQEIKSLKNIYVYYANTLHKQIAFYKILLRLFYHIVREKI